MALQSLLCRPFLTVDGEDDGDDVDEGAVEDRFLVALDHEDLAVRVAPRDLRRLASSSNVACLSTGQGAARQDDAELLVGTRVMVRISLAAVEAATEHAERNNVNLAVDALDVGAAGGASDVVDTLVGYVVSTAALDAASSAPFAQKLDALTAVHSGPVVHDSIVGWAIGRANMQVPAMAFDTPVSAQAVAAAHRAFKPYLSMVASLHASRLPAALAATQRRVHIEALLRDVVQTRTRLATISRADAWSPMAASDLRMVFRGLRVWRGFNDAMSDTHPTDTALDMLQYVAFRAVVEFVLLWLTAVWRCHVARAHTGWCLMPRVVAVMAVA